MTREEFREPDIDQYIADEVPGYVEVRDELTHIHAYLGAGENLLQWGPYGVGKTLSFAYVGAKEEIPVIHFDCARDTKKKDLIVRPWIETDGGEKRTVYIPGALPLAIMAANEHGEAILVLEEISALLPNLQKQLNQIGDWRERIAVPEADTTFSLDDDARLLVGATMNPPGSGSGTFQLNDDLLDRFGELERSFPADRKLGDILDANDVPDSIGSRKDVVESHIVPFLQNIKSLSDADELRSPISPRSGVRIGKMWKHYYRIVSTWNDEGLNPVNESLRLALRSTVLNKYRTREEQDIVREEIENSFGVTIHDSG